MNRMRSDERAWREGLARLVLAYRHAPRGPHGAACEATKHDDDDHIECRCVFCGRCCSSPGEGQCKPHGSCLRRARVLERLVKREMCLTLDHPRPYRDLCEDPDDDDRPPTTDAEPCFTKWCA